MYCKFKTFNVGAGDCITLFLKHGDEEIHIMVDCGAYEKEVDNYIKNEFGSVIDYLIITHIDNDHINGVISMLSSNPQLTIRNILYNCYQRTSDNLQGWDERMKENIERLYGHLPVVVDMLEGKINAETSKSLAEMILNNDNWKNVWRRDYITSDTTPIELEGNMGRLIFLSPSRDALDVLDKKYRELFWKKLYKKKELDYDKEETIYEALMRIVAAEPSTQETFPILATELNEETLKCYADEGLKPLSSENEASIAFIWECGEHRILFLGDASPKCVFPQLDELYRNNAKPILFDAIKVSHHGSAHSTSKEQMNTADSEHYFITGGARTRPSYQALSRIITAPLSEGISHREIRYNRVNDILECLAKEGVLKEKFHFTISSDNEYEFSC